MKGPSRPDSRARKRMHANLHARLTMHPQLPFGADERRKAPTRVSIPPHLPHRSVVLISANYFAYPCQPHDAHASVAFVCTQARLGVRVGSCFLLQDNLQFLSLSCFRVEGFWGRSCDKGSASSASVVSSVDAGSGDLSGNGSGVEKPFYC